MSDLTIRHIPVLDSLRSFAALSVCAFHFICTTTGFINNEWILNLFSIGQYGVQTFFVISGFIIPWSMYHAGFKIKNFFSFFLKRLARLEPPYLFSLTIAVVLLYIRGRFYNPAHEDFHLNGIQLALHFGYLIPFFENYKWLNVVYWTLAVEFQYYLFIALLFIPLIRSVLFFRVIVYAAILGSSFLSGKEFLPYWLPIFLLGILLFLKMVALISLREYFLATFFTVCFSFYHYSPVLVLYALIPVVSVLYCKNLKVWFLDAVGKFSYSLYLIHTLIGATVVNVLSHRSSSCFSKIAIVLSGFTISIISAWMIYLIIEKRSKKLSSSVKYN